MKHRETVIVKRLSVCPCGFPLFNDYVKLGDTYVVNAVIRFQMQMQCGGCKTIFPVICVLTIDNIKLIPEDAFKEPEKVN